MDDAERLGRLQRAEFVTVEEAREWFLEAGGVLAGTDVLGELERRRREDMEYDEALEEPAGTQSDDGNPERKEESEHGDE